MVLATAAGHHRLFGRPRRHRCRRWRASSRLAVAFVVGAGDRLRHRAAGSTWRARRRRLAEPCDRALLHLRASLRGRGHGAVPGLFRADLLAVLLARDALPRLLQAGGAALQPGRRVARAGRCRIGSSRRSTPTSATIVGVLLLFAAIIGSVLTFVYFQVSFEPSVQKEILQSALWTVFFISRDHRRRRGVAVRAGA